MSIKLGSPGMAVWKDRQAREKKQEVKWLHEVNQELCESLKECLHILDNKYGGNLYGAGDRARMALAKAEVEE